MNKSFNQLMIQAKKDSELGERLFKDTQLFFQRTQALKNMVSVSRSMHRRGVTNKNS